MSYSFCLNGRPWHGANGFAIHFASSILALPTEIQGLVRANAEDFASGKGMETSYRKQSGLELAEGVRSLEKMGAAGDAPGGGRWRVRRFAPRLPVTCPDSTTPRPISLFLSCRGNLFIRSVSSFFFQSRRLRYFGTFVRPRHNKWQYVKNVNALCIERPRVTLNDRVKIRR